MRALQTLQTLMVLALLAPAASRAATPRLELRGDPPSTREAEALLAPALARGGDSLAVRESLGRLVERLQAHGHLAARAQATWDSAAATLRVQVASGVLYRLGAWRLDAAPADSALLAGALELPIGAMASPPAWSAAIERALDRAEAEGYPYALLGVTRWDLEGERVVLRLVGSLGPRVVIDSIIVRGLVSTQPRVANRALGRMYGLAYDPSRARAGAQRLEQLGLFAHVDYEGLEGAPDWRFGRLVYRVEEPRYNRIEAALGVQGDAQLVGLGRLDLGNVAGSGRLVSLAWQSRGRGLTDFSARAAEPFALGTPVRLEVSLVQQLQDTSYTRTRFGARAAFPIAGGERAEAGIEGERVVQPAGEVREAALQNTSFSIEHDGRDDPTSPRRGWRGRVTGTQTFQREALRERAGTPESKRRTTSSAVETRFEWHHPLGGANGVALEASAAGRFSSQDVLPDWQRYPLGGASTLRGFDEEAFRVDRYALSRLEWRRVLGRSGERVALFWDQAWMELRRPGERGGRSRETHGGVGFGLRLPAAGGLAELDYGLEPGRGARDGRIHLRLVTAF